MLRSERRGPIVSRHEEERSESARSENVDTQSKPQSEHDSRCRTPVLEHFAQTAPPGRHRFAGRGGFPLEYPQVATSPGEKKCLPRKREARKTSDYWSGDGLSTLEAPQRLESDARWWTSS